MFVLNKKIKGTTLIETIVAMVIILFSFSIFLVTYIKIEKNNKIANKLKSYYLIKNMFTEDMKNKNFESSSTEVDNLTIEKKITPYAESKTLLLYNIKVCDKTTNQKFEINELVKMNE